jgi:hypothetical protein
MNPAQRFEIIAPEEPAISIEHVDPRTHSTFMRLFEGPQLGPHAIKILPFADYCLVLTNRSSQRITALTVWWKYPHPTLRGPSEARNQTDAYYLGDNSNQVLLPEGQSLLYPKGAFAARWLESKSLIHFSSDSGRNGLRPIDMILAAPLVTATIDCIIFEDGRVLGSDESQTVLGIRERKRAAEDFVALVRRAVDEGMNVEEVLKGICATPAQGLARDPYNASLHRFARMLSRFPPRDPLLMIAQFANLPKLPEFWR